MYIGKCLFASTSMDTWTASLISPYKKKLLEKFDKLKNGIHKEILLVVGLDLKS